jgi:hypothetical protein
VRLRHERDTFGAPFGDSVALRISIPLASAPRSAAREAAAVAAVTEPRWPWSGPATSCSSTAPRPTTSWPRRPPARRRRGPPPPGHRQRGPRRQGLAPRRAPTEALLRARAAAFDADAALLRAGLARDQALAWRDYLNGAIE